MNKVIVITGPTATGKTKLSIILARKLNGEVINADSTQVFTIIVFYSIVYLLKSQEFCTLEDSF